MRGCALLLFGTPNIERAKTWVHEISLWASEGLNYLPVRNKQLSNRINCGTPLKGICELTSMLLIKHLDFLL